MHRTGSHRRQLLAGALVLQLCLVTVAPLWHHGHHRPDVSGHTTGTTSADLHICSTGDHLSGVAGPCPICFSQRLLTNGLTEHAVQPTSPSDYFGSATSDTEMLAEPVCFWSQPRAPPPV